MVCSILLAVLACAALPGVSDASRKLRGYGFTTSVPSTWKTGKGKNGTTRVYGAAPPGVKPNDVVNAIHLGITVVPTADMERQIGRKLPSLEQVLVGVMTTPQQAQNVSLVAPIRSTTLDRLPAAAGAAEYFFNGATVLQSETVAIHRGRVYIIRYYQDTSLQYSGIKILQSIHRHWRWR